MYEAMILFAYVPSTAYHPQVYDYAIIMIHCGYRDIW